MGNSERLKKFFEAENNRDWESLSALLHPDVMWFLHSETTHTPIAGREEYMEQLTAGYEGSDDSFTCEHMEISSSGNRIVAMLRSNTGARSIAIFDFEEDLIRWEYEYSLD